MILSRMFLDVVSHFYKRLCSMALWLWHKESECGVCAQGQFLWFPWWDDGVAVSICSWHSHFSHNSNSVKNGYHCKIDENENTRQWNRGHKFFFSFRCWFSHFFIPLRCDKRKMKKNNAVPSVIESALQFYQLGAFWMSHIAVDDPISGQHSYPSEIVSNTVMLKT